jgi:orotate phosphoribosyltransferase
VSDPVLAAEINSRCRLTGEFTLRSGQVATHYFDKYRFEGDPALLRDVAKAMIALVPVDVALLAGLELGGVPIATAMSLESGLRAVFVRKEAKSYGTCLAAEGGGIRGKRVMLVEDVITTGGAVADAAELVEQAGGEIAGVVCAIWRGEGEPRIARRPDLPARAAFTAAELDRS